jgi:hypothetical protein
VIKHDQDLGFFLFDWATDIGSGIWNVASGIGSGIWEVTTDIGSGIQNLVDGIFGGNDVQLPPGEEPIIEIPLEPGTPAFDPSDPNIYQGLPWYKQFWYQFEDFFKPAATFGLQYFLIKELYPQLMPPGTTQPTQPTQPTQQPSYLPSGTQPQLTPAQEEMLRQYIEEQKKQAQMAVLIPAGLIIGGIVIFLIGRATGD